MPDKTEEQRKKEEQEKLEARKEELTDEQLDQAAGGLFGSKHDSSSWQDVHGGEE
ncbi:MAG: hypothetical protein LBP80_09450 [Treponema sp.]|jgi:Zn-dependent M16 (insulinase) family peptidase|nr:hypothetical protein [Treponema sp.]